ncbi:MAG: hypothetical protein ACLP9K_05430 [Nitrososphaerales archaeon]
MSYPASAGGRWENYFLANGPEFGRFWETYLQNEERNLICILGLGFDPRASRGYSRILEAKGRGKRDLLEIELEGKVGLSSSAQVNLIEANRKTLTRLVPSGSRQTVNKLLMWSEGRRVGGRRAASLIGSLADLSEYSDVVVDISALPRGIFFPLIGKILYLIDDWSEKNMGEGRPNLHVIVSENAFLDGKITEQEVDRDASYVHGFTGGLDSEATNSPRVWIPILGERQGVQLETIHTLVRPAETCPILPTPAVEARRADDLIIEYRELLFDRLLVEAKNLIYASEQNPFEVYHQILKTVSHYKASLRPLGDCQVAISALSSKLLSIGAMLAAYEMKDQGVGLAQVESQGYNLEEVDFEEESRRSELFTMWLAGEPYEP